MIFDEVFGQVSASEPSFHSSRDILRLLRPMSEHLRSRIGKNMYAKRLMIGPELCNSELLKNSCVCYVARTCTGSTGLWSRFSLSHTFWFLTYLESPLHRWTGRTVFHFACQDDVFAVRTVLDCFRQKTKSFIAVSEAKQEEHVPVRSVYERGVTDRGAVPEHCTCRQLSKLCKQRKAVAVMTANNQGKKMATDHRQNCHLAALVESGGSLRKRCLSAI